MTLRMLFTINVPISLFFGVACLLFPEWLVSLYGGDLTTSGIYMTRLAGAAYLGFAALAIQARRTKSTEFLLALALALFIQDSIGAFVSFYAQIAGHLTALGWTTVALYSILALGYGYFRFIRPESPNSS
jgi:hypothetical protein